MRIPNASGPPGTGVATGIRAMTGCTSHVTSFKLSELVVGTEKLAERVSNVATV